MGRTCLARGRNLRVQLKRLGNIHLRHYFLSILNFIWQHLATPPYTVSVTNSQVTGINPTNARRVSSPWYSKVSHDMEQGYPGRICIHTPGSGRHYCYWLVILCSKGFNRFCRISLVRRPKSKAKEKAKSNIMKTSIWKSIYLHDTYHQITAI